MSEDTQVKSYKVLPSEFSEARYTTNRWSITARAGTPYEAILGDPAYWAHIATKLKQCDIIEVHAQDRSYYAELYVLAAESKSARVAELCAVTLDNSPTVTLPSNYDVEWAGPHHKWRVIRISDKTVIEKGFASEADARLHAVQTNKKLAA